MTQRTIVLLSISLFFSALFWGIYTFIVYLGIPIHELVYLSREQVAAVDAVCGNAATIGTYLCRGSSVLWDFFTSFLQMGSPFGAYTLISLLMYGGFLLWNGYHTGHFQIRYNVRPIALVGAFVFAVWLMATTFSLGSLHNLKTPPQEKIFNAQGKQVLQPFRTFFEPLRQVYPGVGPQAMQELQENYQSLLARGCLTQVGKVSSGVRVYDLHFLCMQQSLFARVGIQVLMVSLFLLNLLVLGRFLLRMIRATDQHPLFILCFSLALGALGFVAILWTLGIFGLLKSSLIRTLFFGMPLVLWMETMWWAKTAWKKTIHFEASWNSLLPILAWLLITYLALNFLNVVRPFPIGWDDLGSYLNRPRLLTSYGQFIASMSQFQWEYLSSLGFLLFGYDSWNGSALAMLINWSAGLLAVLVSYSFARLYFGPRYGILTAILYYFLPMTGHFSFADMKIDNAVFFAGTAALLAAYAALMPPQTEEKNKEGEGDKKPSYRLLLIAGLLAGFAFGIKPTAVLSILMIGSIMMGFFFGPIGFTGMAIIGFGILQYFGALDLNGVALRLFGTAGSLDQSIVSAVTLFTGLLILGVSVWKKYTLLRTTAQSIGFFFLGLIIAVSPWIIHNISIAGNFSVGSMLAAQDLVTPQVFYVQKEDVDAMRLPSSIPVRYLPPELALDPNHAACKGSARTEELDRYWGFNTGLSHYLTLPWRQVMNIDAFGYYVTFMPALLLLPLALLLPFFWTKKGRWLRLLFAGTSVFLIQWALVGNGIPWYGIGMFFGFSLLLESFIVFAPDTLNRRLFGTLLTLSIVVCLINRLWQFDAQKNIFEYPLGKVTATALREITIPDYDDIRQSVITSHETIKDAPYTYRVGTFISYFIPRNREILPLADHQLTFFNCLNQERDHALTLKRLKALGFNSIIFDTNTQTIEKNVNGTLHQKVNAFRAFMDDTTTGIDVVVNDPGNGIVYILLP